MASIFRTPIRYRYPENLGVEDFEEYDEKKNNDDYRAAWDK